MFGSVPLSTTAFAVGPVLSSSKLAEFIVEFVVGAGVSGLAGSKNGGTASLVQSSSWNVDGRSIAAGVAAFVASSSFKAPGASVAAGTAEVIAEAVMDAIATVQLLPGQPVDGQRVQVGWRYYVWRAALGSWRPDGPAPHKF